MAKYRKKPVVIEATRWFKNGDHPEDKSEVFNSVTSPGGTILTEGKIVRRYRVPESCSKIKCQECDDIMHNHGWIDEPNDCSTVCPGDWVITRSDGSHCSTKPEVFEKMYEREE